MQARVPLAPQILSLGASRSANADVFKFPIIPNLLATSTGSINNANGFKQARRPVFESALTAPCPLGTLLLRQIERRT